MPIPIYKYRYYMAMIFVFFVYILYKFGDIRSSNSGDYVVTNARRAVLVAILPDNCHQSSWLKSFDTLGHTAQLIKIRSYSLTEFVPLTY